MIDVTLLGTAALMPLPDRSLTAASICCSGHTLLIDCGDGMQIAARRYDTGVFGADIIALTHYHGDHILGLPGLLLSMQSMARKHLLTIVGPEGIQQALAPIMALAGEADFPIRLLEMPAEGIPLGSMGWPAEARLTPIPTAHRVISQGYAFTLGRAAKFDPVRARALGLPVQLWGRLQHGESVMHQGRSIAPAEVLGEPRSGLKVVMTGDTTFCPALIEGAEGADLLISEATYGDNDQTDLAREHGHMTFAQAGRLAAEAHVRRLWLTHFSQRMQRVEDFLPNAQAAFPRAVCGVDGMHIHLAFED